MVNSLISALLLLFINFGFVFQFAKNADIKAFKHISVYSNNRGINDNPVMSPQDVIFLVKHSKGPNVVVYQANINSQKSLDDKKPIDVFWLMNTKGKTTESLTTIEWRLAYGFKLVTLVKGKKYKLTLNAIKNKEIFICMEDNGKVESFMNLNGQYSKLRDVFIKFEYTLYLPDVKYVEFTGYSVADNKLTAERVWSD